MILNDAYTYQTVLDRYLSKEYLMFEGQTSQPSVFLLNERAEKLLNGAFYYHQQSG